MVKTMEPSEEFPFDREEAERILRTAAHEYKQNDRETRLSKALGRTMLTQAELVPMIRLPIQSLGETALRVDFSIN